MKKSILIVSFAFFTIICLCFINIPQACVWQARGSITATQCRLTTVRMASIINLQAGKTYAAQPVIEKPYIYSSNQAVVSSRPAMVHSYGGNTGIHLSGNVVAPVATHYATPSIASPYLSPVQSARAASASASAMHKPMMRKNRAAAPSTFSNKTTDKVLAPMIASHGLSLGYEAAASYMTPAVYRAPGSGLNNALNNWLISGSGSGALLYGDATTGYYYDMAMLQDLFNQMQANGDMPGMTWEEFLAWFNSGEQNRHFMPLGDAWWMLALLALGYAILLRRKYNRQTMKME